jgi:beta-lactamase superfamily II metal-dependent hydrolase
MKLKVLFFAVSVALLMGCNENGKENGENGNGKGNDTPAVEAPVDVQVGQALPAWEEGYLDIHSINGGRGEAFYYIFPDGTTMLCDAAGAPPMEQHNYADDSQGVPSKPSVGMNSGAVIVEYIKHFAPSVANGRLDYFMTSHYHGDHIGAWRSNYSTFGWTAFNKEGEKVSAVNLNDGGFLLNGVAEVGLSIPFDKVLDRGDWSSRPSADYYDDGGQNRYKLYVNYLDYASRKQGTVRETLKIGHDDQIVMKHDASKYPTFAIRTIASGGDVWTGSGTEVNTSYVPGTEECKKNHAAWSISENIFSNVFLVRYGNFDFFSGGDIQYSGRSSYPWKDIENPISQVVKKVEGMKACHHSTANTNSDNLLNKLKPDFYIAGVWRDVQPNPETLQRVYNANPSVRIFTTNLAESNIATLKGKGIDPAKFSSTGGHVVIRVLPEGKKYYIFVLNDNNTDYKVKAKFGPYTAFL